VNVKKKKEEEEEEEDYYWRQNINITSFKTQY
jgi:hypothetical protein